MKRLLVALMVVLSIFSVAVSADTSSNYQVDGVRIDGMDISSYTVEVENGQTVPLDIYLTGTGETTDVTVKAWIGGYEYDNVEVNSAMFKVDDGVSYKKTLDLVMPNDLIADQDYTLYVEVFDNVDSYEYTGTIHVEKVRHLLNILDVVLDNSVNAGDYSTAIVRLENYGDQKEEDIKVTVSIPELGIEKSEYLSELTNNEIANADEESSGEVSLTYQIPADAATGNYDVVTTVTYNEGYSTVDQTNSISVVAAPVAETQDSSAVTVVVPDTSASSTSDANSSSSSTDFSTALRLGFGILAVLIVILALILIVRR